MSQTPSFSYMLLCLAVTLCFSCKSTSASKRSTRGASSLEVETPEEAGVPSPNSQAGKDNGPAFPVPSGNTGSVQGEKRPIKYRVRTLSLGERMRCEIAAALLHRPQVLLADEPTIGLDIVAKNSLRQIIKNWQKHEQTTLMLTSHDLSDVEALCDRCILIDQGTMRFDGPLGNLKGPLQYLRRILVTTNDPHKSILTDAFRFRLRKVENPYSHLYEVLTNEQPMSESLFALSQHYGESLQDISIGEVTLEEVLGAQYAAR